MPIRQPNRLTPCEQPMHRINPQHIINIMDEEQGFCLQKLQVVTHHSNYQPPHEPHLHIQLSCITQPQLQIQRQIDDSQLRYINLLRGCPLVSHQIREEWCQGLLMEIPSNRIIMNNVDQRKEISFSRNNLVFDSQFQCGNLDLVVKVRYNEYDLFVRPDTNTTGNFQWFYFKVMNGRREQTVKLNVRNMAKPNRLYEDGLAPYYSRNNGEWRQLNKQVNKVGLIEECPYQEYCLTFTYTFVEEGDVVCFANNPPYSFNRLMQILSPLKIQSLCESALNFQVPRVSFFPKKKKTNIASVGLAIARQHPAQAVGSWMMQGFLQQICQRELDDVCWYVIPMVNVDGVYLGNSRTGVAGYDYNRLHNIDEPVSVNRDKLAPEIIAIGNLVKRLKKKYGKKFKMFLDFHGHSSRPNIFTYGPPYGVAGTDEYVEARLFPQIIGQRTSLFKAADCSYNIPPIKRNTARSVLFNKYKIPFCYTIESSFGLADGKQINPNQLIDVGRKIAESSLQFLSYLDQKTDSEVTKSKYLIERIKNHMNQPEKVEKADDSDSSDGEMEREESKMTDLAANNTAGSAQDLRQSSKLILHRQRVIQRQTFLNRGYLIKHKILDDKFSIDNSKKIPLSTRYRVTTQSFRGTATKTKQAVSVRPMTKFVPRLQIYTRNNRQIKLNNPQLTRPVKTPQILRANHSAMILNNIEYSNQSIDRFRSNSKPTVTSSPQKKNRPQNRPVALLQQLSKNNKNKVGRQMLIINQF